MTACLLAWFPSPSLTTASRCPLLYDIIYHGNMGYMIARKLFSFFPCSLQFASKMGSKERPALSQESLLPEVALGHPEQGKCSLEASGKHTPLIYTTWTWIEKHVLWLGLGGLISYKAKALFRHSCTRWCEHREEVVPNPSPSAHKQGQVFGRKAPARSQGSISN